MTAAVQGAVIDGKGHRSSGGQGEIVMRMPHVKGSSVSPLLFAATLAVLGAVRPAEAQFTWNGGGTTDNFTDAANWLGGVAPTTNGTFIFDGSTRLSPNNNLTLTGADNTLTFAASAGAFAVGGGAIRMGTVTNSSSNPQTLNVSLRLNGTRTINTGTAGMTLSVLPLSTGASARNMTKTGSGDLTLTFASTYALMNYAVNAGRLVINNAAGTFSQGATTTLAAGTELVLAQPATANFTAAITGAGLVRKTGAGSSTFSGPNAYTGGTLVQNGILTYASDFTMSGSNGFALTNAASPVRGTDYGAMNVSAGTLTYGGSLALTLGGLLPASTTYDLFNFSGGSQAGSFSSVAITGSYSTPLTNAGGGVWTGSQGDATFTFTESTGDLAVTIVPEPTSCLALAASVGLGVVMLRRRTTAE
jgi:autotransporter-associated beta strand protein